MSLFKDIGHILAGTTDEIEWWDEVWGLAPTTQDEMPRIPAPRLRCPWPLADIRKPYGDNPATVH